VAMQFGWRIALMAVFIEGIFFIILSLFNFRERIFDTVPKNIKYSISVGIGLFIAFIGFQNGGLVVNHYVTGVTMGDTTYLPTVLFMVGLLLTMVLLVKKVKGAIFIGILSTYMIGLLCQLMGFYVVGVHGPSLIPSGLVSLPPSVADVSIVTVVHEVFDASSPYSFSALFLAQDNSLDWSAIFNFAAIIFALFFVDVFDTVGTLIGVSEKANFLDKNGKLPRAKQAFLADAVGSIVGAAVGTSTTTTYIESATGVAEGGKTGLTAVFVAALFAVSLFFWPIFSVIPSFATAPALVAVGLFMASLVTKIDFSDFAEGFPAFLTMILMPFTFSIADGILFGILSYVGIKVVMGKFKEISVTMYVMSIFFIVVLAVV